MSQDLDSSKARGPSGCGREVVSLVERTPDSELSIITNVFTEHGERARAIGLWGASTGIAIALGPIVGGALIAATTLTEAGAPGAAESLGQVALNGFIDGLQAGCLVASAVCAAGAIVCFIFLPAQPRVEPGVEAMRMLDTEQADLTPAEAAR